jgi:hypothetical protein
MVLVQYFARKGKQCDVASAFDCKGNSALMFRAGSRLPARSDFAILGDKPFQLLGVFVVELYGFVCAELANPRTAHGTSAAASHRSVTHVYSSV